MATLTVSTEYTGLRDGNSAVADGSWDSTSIEHPSCGTSYEANMLSGTISGGVFDVSNRANMSIKIKVNDVYIGKASFDLDAGQTLNVSSGTAGLTENSDNNYTLTLPSGAKLEYEIKVTGKLNSNFQHPWGTVYAGAGGQAKTVVIYSAHGGYACV